MKKIVLFLFVVIATLSVSAQSVYVGGAFGLWRNDDADMTSFKIAPEVGYNLNEKWAVGVVLEYEHASEHDLSGNAFSIAPYARYSFYENKLVRLFADGGFGFLTVKEEHLSMNGFEIGVTPGIAIKLNHHFSLVAKCGFLGYRSKHTSDPGFGLKLSSEDLTFGFHYEF